MTDIASLNIRINSLEAKMAKQDLDRLTGAGKQAETRMGSMSKAAARLGVALAAAFSVQKMSQFIQNTALLYARFETLGVVMNKVGQNAGYSSQQMATFEQGLRESGIAAIEARTVLTRMTQAQIDLAQSSKLARIAQDAAVIGNINSSEAFERMVHGIQSAQVEVLRTIGLNVNFEQSYKALADQLGVTREQLSETQKAQARVNVVMEAGTAISGVYEASMNTAGKQLASMKRYTDDLKVSIGETFNEALVLLVKQTTLELKGMQNTMKGLKEDGSLDEWGANFATVVAGTMDIILLVTATITSVTSTISAAIKQLRLVAEAVYDILSLDFAGAKSNIQGFAEIGIEWWDKMEERWTSPTFTDTLKKMRMEAEISSKALQGTYDMDYGSWADGIEEVENGTNDLTDALKRAREEQEKWEHESAIKAIQYAEEARAEAWQQEIEMMNAMVAREKEAWEQLQKDKTDAEEKARREAERAEEKARQEYEREWKRVYDDMHEFAADTFYDLFKDTEGFWGNLLDTMEDMFIRSIANMAASGAMTNIFGPLMNQMAGSVMGNFFGLPTAGGSGFGIPGIGSIGNLFSGDGLTSVPPSGWVNPAYQGPGMGAAVSPASVNWAGIGTSIGTAAVGSIFAGVSMKLASDIIGRSADKPAISFAVHDPSDPAGYFPGSGWHYGMKSSEFGYRAGVKDTGQDSAIGQALFDYFDALFTGIEATTSIVMNDVLQKHIKYIGYAEGANIQELSNNVFSELLPSLLISLFPDAETLEKEFQYRAGSQKMTGGGREGGGTYYEPVYDTIMRQVPVLADHFTEAFFDAITPEEGTRWDAFMQFANVVENTEGFIEDFNRRIDDLGQTAVDAYEQIQLISGVLAEMDAAVSTLTSGTATAQLDSMVDTWNAYIDVMRQAQATAEQLTEAEANRNLVVGSQITGLNVNSIAQALGSGQDISAIVGQAINQLVNEQIASEMFDELSPLVEEAGRIWSETGGDIDAVSAYLKEAGYYFEELSSSMDAFVQEAELIVAEALQGTLTASQLFLQWGIQNAEAAALLADITSDQVTISELEKAVDAFSDLGLEGKDLTTVIGYLTDAFVDSATRLSNALNGIDTAKETIPGTVGTTPSQSFEAAFNRFLNTPSLSSIVNPDYRTESVFDEEAYKAMAVSIANELGYFADEQGTLWTVSLFEKAIDELGTTFRQHLDDVGTPILGIALEDVSKEIREPIPGTGATSSEKAISDALVKISQYKSSDFDILTGYQDFFNTLNSIDSQVLYDIYGEGAADMISNLSAQYAEYQSALEQAAAEANRAADAKKAAAEAETAAEKNRLTQIGSILDRVQDDLNTIDMTDLEKALYNIERQTDDWILRLEDLGAAEEDLALIREWSSAQTTAAAQAEQERIAAIQAELLNQKLSLENQLYTLLEDEEALKEVINQQRQIELDAMDESLRPIQEHIWALQDEAIAAEEAAAAAAAQAALLNQRLGLENQLYTLLENQTTLQKIINQQRQIELDAMDESLRPIQEHIWALQDEAIAARKEAELLNSKLALEHQLYTLMENEVALQSVIDQQRQIELSSMDESSKAIQTHIWALQDEAASADRAAQALSNATSARDDAANAYLSALQSELSNLQSSFDSAKNIYVGFLQDAISSHQEELQILEGRMNDAKSNYLSALQSEASEQEALANSIGSAIDSIRDFRKSLSTGTDSPLNLEQRQAELMLQQTVLAGQAKAGDIDSVSELINISSEYLDVTKSLASNEFEYAREVSRTSNLMSDVESSLGVQKSAAERQAESLQNIYDSVSGTSRTAEGLAAAESAYYSAKSAFDRSSHRTEIDHLQNIIDEVTMANKNAQTLAEAQAEYEAAKMALDENWYTDEIAMLEGLLGKTQSIEELMEAFISAQAGYEAARIAAANAQATATQELADAQRVLVQVQGTTNTTAPGQAPFNFDYDGVQHFATGGSFSVAGMSGRDNLTLPDLRVSAGEIVNISRPDVMSNVTEELTALRAEVTQLRKENQVHAIAQIKSSQAIERNTDYLESWDVNGLPAEEAAA